MSLAESRQAVLAIGSQHQVMSPQVQGTQSEGSGGCTQLPSRPPITLLADDGANTLAGVDSRGRDTHYLLDPATGSRQQ